MTCTGSTRKLSSLKDMRLDPANQAALRDALRHCPDYASSPWGRRMAAEIETLLKLQQLAPPGRMKVLGIEASEDLRIRILLRVDCPALRPDGQVQVVPYADIGLMFTAECLNRTPQSVSLLVFAPRLHHPNCMRMPGRPIQVLCLGDHHVTMPVSALGSLELVLLSYSILNMSTVTLHADDPLHVADGAAAAYWLQHHDQLPLGGGTPFLAPVGNHGGKS
jgi:hypothetical protein